jgi:hypothetical protein
MRASMLRALRATVVVVAAAGAIGLGACSSDEVANNQCPVLCPGGGQVVLDTTLEAVTLDTVLPGFPVQGTEPVLLLATAPTGALDVRALVRYDSVLREFAPSFADTLRPVTAPDSARFELRVDTLASRATASFTIEAYDVDTTIVDTATAALAQHFRAEKLLARATFAPADIKDTMRVPFVNVPRLVTRLRDNARVRVGFRVVSSGTVLLSVGATDGLRDAKLRFRPAADSGLPTFTLPPRSATPQNVPGVAAALADFTWVVTGSLPVPANEIAVGGAPGARTYLGLSVPEFITDSTNVVRATLELVQRPYRGTRLRDTLAVYPLLVVTGTAADIARSAAIAIPAVSALRAQLGQKSFTDSLKLVVTDSGVRRFDITAAVREWRLSGPTGMRRAVVLRIAPENHETGQVRFFSREAAAGVRPRLRLVYTARPGSGLP